MISLLLDGGSADYPDNFFDITIESFTCDKGISAFGGPMFALGGC
jgi:hypothetical protein